MGIRKKLRNFFYKRKFEINNSSQLKFSEKSVLITGANSGIGLALTEKLLDLNNTVYATFNKSSENLIKIKNKNLFLIKCDHSNLQEIDNIKNIILQKSINLIINNAAVSGSNDQNFDSIDYEKFQNAILINVLSVLKISHLVLKNAKISSLKTIVNISSEMGSISKNLNGGHYIYRTTKAALNAITKNMAIDLNKKYDINVFAIHPGRVKTKMNPEGLIDVKTCALNILNLLSTNDDSINGKFIDLQKNEIPW